MGLFSTNTPRGLTTRSSTYSHITLSDGYGRDSMQLSSAANNWGSYVQLHPGTASDYYLVSLIIAPNGMTGLYQYSLRLATGAAGAETVIGDMPFICPSSAGYYNMALPIAPIRIPANTRLAASLYGPAIGHTCRITAAGVYTSSLES